MFWPCETRTSTCRNFATISSGLYRFLVITVLLDVKDIPQVGPLQWGRITHALASITGQGWRGRSSLGRALINRDRPASALSPEGGYNGLASCLIAVRRRS